MSLCCETLFHNTLNEQFSFASVLENCIVFLAKLFHVLGYKRKCGEKNTVH